MRIKKFASEIFRRRPLVLMLHCGKRSRFRAGFPVKTAWDQAFRGCSHRRECRFSFNGAQPVPDKELVKACGCEAPSRSRFPPMPRYFFNTRIGDELISDPEGEVLRDADRAWEMARAMIRELLKTEGADGALLNATIEVTDDEGEIVLEFPFAEAILDVPDGRRITKH
jgi:hypothetical protein